jgi:hypothetical protein
MTPLGQYYLYGNFFEIFQENTSRLWETAMMSISALNKAGGELRR